MCISLTCNPGVSLNCVSDDGLYSLFGNDLRVGFAVKNSIYFTGYKCNLLDTGLDLQLILRPLWTNNYCHSCYWLILLLQVLCLNVAIGHVKMSPEELQANATLAINFLVSLLKKNWQNVRALYIKSTMGPSHQVF